MTVAAVQPVAAEEENDSVEADPDPGSICEAVRAGRVEVRTSPLGRFQALTLFGDLFMSALLTGNLWRRG